MNRVFILFFTFLSVAMLQNTGHAFFATQKSANSADKFTIDEARKIVASWRSRVTAARGDASKITATIQVIQADRQTIQDALNKNPDQDLKKSLEQIKILLELAEIRAIIKESAQAKQSFGSVFSQFTGGGSSGFQQGQKYNKDWYNTTIRRLASLLKQFDTFTKRYPQILTNPPALLVGIDQTLQQARETGKTLQQYESCFDKPDQSYCARLSSQGDNQFGQSQLFDPEGFDDEEFYDNNDF